MKFYRAILSAIVLFVLSSQLVHGQSVADLRASYSGETDWNSASGTLTFSTTGVVTFAKKSVAVQHFWKVPTDVKEIVIGEDVRVTCAFHTSANCTIRGVNRKSSVVYGTDVRSWAQTNNVKAFEHCQFQNFGGTMTIRNLTSKNPFGFHVRGWGKKIMVSYCDFIDTRGGSGNHSDGIEAGDGSVIDNCYFETGDDIFKIYFDNTITNCTVNMVENAVPIQLGWGNYSNGAVGTFKNLTITGNSGRGNKGTYPVICGRTGKYDVTINIDSCTIVNPNAHLVMLWDDNDDGIFEKTVRGSITNAFIDIKGYSNYLLGTSLLNVCGSDERKSDYNCLTTSSDEVIGQCLPAVYPNPAHNVLHVDTDQSFKIFNTLGIEVFNSNSSISYQPQVNIEGWTNGLYFIQINNTIQPIIKN